MFEQLCYTIIKELGPTGLLIIGLYYILDKTNKELIKELKVINDEIKELSVNLDRIASAKEREKHGEIRRHTEHTIRTP